MAVAAFPIGPLQTNSYLIHKTSKAVAIDVGGDPAPMLEYLNTHHLKLDAICITHRHFDHMYGVAALEEATGALVYIPQDDDSLAGTDSTGQYLCHLSQRTPRHIIYTGFEYLDAGLDQIVCDGQRAASDAADRLILSGHTASDVQTAFQGREIA